MTSMATRWLFSFSLALLLVTGSAFAQGTTASLTGRVVDTEGEALAGVNVVAIHQPTGTQYGTATGPNGRYTILSVRTGGPYLIRASFVGFQTVERTGIRLELDEKRTIDFTMEEQTAEMEEVRVVAQTGEVIAKNRTGAAKNVSEEQIDRLPTISRSITDFTRLVPQAQGDGSIAGANSRYNSIQIDGATLDDVFGLGDAVPGSQAGAEPISLDAIQEFNVNVAPYDVRSGGFTGGQVNAITKSGTNQFEGLFRARGGTEWTTGDFEGEGTGEFNRSTLVGQVGGPIIEDRLFFFVNAEMKRESAPLDVRVGQNVSGPNVFNEPVETLNTFQSIFQNTYGYDPGGISPLTQRQDDEKFLAKLDWNITDNHRLTLRNNYVNARDDSGIGRGTSSFDYGNRQYIFRSIQNSATAQLNSTFGDNMFNEARFVYTRIRDERDVQDRAFPEVTVDLGGGDELGAGIGRFNQANRLGQDLYEFTNDFTYVTGDHTLTVGTSNKFFQFSNLFIQDFFGSYTFEGFESPAGEEISVEELLRNGQPTQYQYSYATEAAGTDQPLAEFSAFQFGGYVQDEWQALPSLRLTLGLRVDVPVLPDQPTFNRTAFEAFGRSTRNIASGNPLWSPRLGFNYDQAFLGDDLSTQVRGGVGIFSGDPPYVWISNQYSNTGADLNRISATFEPIDYTQDPAACRASSDPANDPACEYDPDRRFVPTDIGENPTAQPLPTNAPFCQDNPGSPRCSDLLAPETTTEINLVSDDFQYPQTLRANLAVDQELPLGFIGTIEGIYSNTVNDVAFRNINLVQTGTSKYGRPLYNDRVSGRFTNALLLENTNKGYQYSITGEIQRNVVEGIDGSFAYTYTQARIFNESLDINNPRIGTADYELRHRIIGTLNYRFTYADRFATTVGLVYEGRSGSPYAWVYDGNANGDGPAGDSNDLLYVPENESDILLESDNWELMNSFIESNEALDAARGSVIRRGASRGPWRNLLDVRFAQSFETFEGQRLELTFDIENFLNLLNDDWGRILTNSSFREAWSFEGYLQPEDVGTEIEGRIITEEDVGKPRVSFSEELVTDQLSGQFIDASNIASRWRMRLGLKYSF
jgi:hypothetical protein